MSKFLRQRRRRRAALVLSVGCFLLAIPGFAAAATAGPEPLAPVDAVQETVDAVLDPVEDAGQPVTDTLDSAGEVAEPVTGPVETTVDTVTDVVDDGAPPVDDPVRPDTGDTGGSITTRPPQSSTNGGEDAGRVRTHGEPAARDTAARQPPRSVRESTAAALRSAPVIAAEDAAPRDRQAPASAADQVSRAVADASRAFRFPLLVAGALLLFLAIQGRIDSRDPKLSSAAEDEELMFA